MISILMPSRRKERFPIAYQSIVETTEGPWELIVGQNPDCIFDLPEGVQRYVSESGPSKRGAEMAPMAKGEILMGGADDFIWRTKGWDRIFMEKAKENPIACFYFHDGSSHMLSRIPVVTRKFYEIVGFPHHFYHFYADTWIVDIAAAAKCLFYVPEVVIEHMHPKFNKGPKDDVYHMRGDPERDIWKKTVEERNALGRKLRLALA